ncbi:MAG TPA: XrtA system polysaccharide deacetylase, partial [candidate division Zixibacteria bacterium]|nr:XrtA system polysaccharide deacetylase [candidate division Zixibacteria bacterium]
MTNVLTVDLEEWFVVEIFAGRIDPSEWESLPSRVEHSGYLILEALEERKTRATFFVLGWVAERHPGLIKDIAHAGHEIACHSYWHRRVDLLTPEVFREDTARALEVIERAAGVRPRGYRAPSWSINSDAVWALDILADLGFQYDSSVFPVKHDIYGDVKAPQRLAKLNLSNGRSILEFPASTVRLFGRNLPVAGGGYLRHSPYWYSSMMIRRLNREGHPAMVYVHPWEFDTS